MITTTIAFILGIIIGVPLGALFLKLIDLYEDYKKVERTVASITTRVFEESNNKLQKAEESKRRPVPLVPPNLRLKDEVLFSAAFPSPSLTKIDFADRLTSAAYKALGGRIELKKRIDSRADLLKRNFMPR